MPRIRSRAGMTKTIVSEIAATGRIVGPKSAHTVGDRISRRRRWRRVIARRPVIARVPVIRPIRGCYCRTQECTGGDSQPNSGTGATPTPAILDLGQQIGRHARALTDLRTGDLRRRGRNARHATCRQQAYRGNSPIEVRHVHVLPKENQQMDTHSQPYSLIHVKCVFEEPAPPAGPKVGPNRKIASRRSLRNPNEYSQSSLSDQYELSKQTYLFAARSERPSPDFTLTLNVSWRLWATSIAVRDMADRLGA